MFLLSCGILGQKTKGGDRQGARERRGRDEGGGQVTSVGWLSASRLGSATGPAPMHSQFELRGV